MFNKIKDNKKVENCVDCFKPLAKNSPHHFRCHTCWLRYNKTKANKEHGRSLIKVSKKVRTHKVK